MKHPTLITLLCLTLWPMFGGQAGAAALDFSQEYERGKLLSKQGMFHDAAKILDRVVRLTARGKVHFGAHIYLSQALWKVGNVSRAMEVIQRSKKIIQMRRKVWSVNRIRQRSKLVTRLESKLLSLFGVVRILPGVSPQAVGRLRIQFLSMAPIRGEFQKRVSKFMTHKMMKQGIVLTGKDMYLPKGTYQLALLEPQCLQYALTSGDAIMRQVEISSQPVVLTLKGKPSCKCSEGRVLRRQGTKRFCACPKGTVWHDKQKRCKMPKISDNRPWLSRSWPWLAVAGAAVVAAGVIVPVVLIESQTREREVVIQGKLFTKP